MDKILPQRTSHYGLNKATQASQICFIADTVAEGRYRSISFSNNVLTLEVKNSIIAQKIQSNSQSIINNINNKLGAQAVKKIKFRVLNS